MNSNLEEFNETIPLTYSIIRGRSVTSSRRAPRQSISLHVPSHFYTQSYTLYYLYLLSNVQYAALTRYAYWIRATPIYFGDKSLKAKTMTDRTRILRIYLTPLPSSSWRLDNSNKCTYDRSIGNNCIRYAWPLRQT